MQREKEKKLIVQNSMKSTPECTIFIGKIKTTPSPSHTLWFLQPFDCPSPTEPPHFFLVAIN